MQDLKAALNEAIAALASPATAQGLWERLQQAVVVQPQLPAASGQPHVLPLFDISYELHEVEVRKLLPSSQVMAAVCRA